MRQITNYYDYILEHRTYQSGKLTETEMKGRSRSTSSNWDFSEWLSMLIKTNERTNAWRVESWLIDLNGIPGCAWRQVVSHFLLVDYSADLKEIANVKQSLLSRPWRSSRDPNYGSGIVNSLIRWMTSQSQAHQFQFLKTWLRSCWSLQLETRHPYSAGCELEPQSDLGPPRGLHPSANMRPTIDRRDQKARSPRPWGPRGWNSERHGRKTISKPNPSYS